MGSFVSDQGDPADILSSSVTSLGDNWSCSITPYDGFDYGNKTYSNNLTIRENTCACPASPAAWDVNMADNCWLNSVCNITGYDLTLYGSGNFTVNSTLYVNELNNLSDGMTVWMKPDGLIYSGVN